MGRLRQLPPRMAGLPPKVKAQPKVAERFYQSAEWQDYRKRHRRWTAQQQGGVWCCKCGSTHRLILDHKVERKDGGEDFPPFDQAEWYCGPCHNRKTVAVKGRRAHGQPL